MRVRYYWLAKTAVVFTFCFLCGRGRSLAVSCVMRVGVVVPFCVDGMHEVVGGPPAAPTCAGLFYFLVGLVGGIRWKRPHHLL